LIPKLKGQYTMLKREYLTALFGGIAVIGASAVLFQAQPVVAQAQGSAAVLTIDGKLQIPKGFRSGFSLVHR